MTDQPTWVPAACTLPTADQPLRVAEFDDLFASALRGVDRRGPTELRLTLDRDAEQAARDLTEREAACCSFFTFTLTLDDAHLFIDIKVPAAHVDVLDAIGAQAKFAREAVARGAVVREAVVREAVARGAVT